MAETNGNGNGSKVRETSDGWRAIAPAAVVLTLLGTIFAVITNGFATDRAEQWEAIRRFTDGPNSLDALVERVQQVRDMTLANKERIEQAYLELDDKLQRESRLADETLRTEVDNVDKRLQSEIANNAHALVSLEEALRDLHASAWMRTDQERFEHQAGFTLVKTDMGGPPR